MLDVTLYQYYRSSSSWRVRWALHYKGINFESKPVNLLKSEQYHPDYLRINPLGFVPSIKVGDENYSDSTAILEWLEEVCPTPALLPLDPRSRMRVRQLYQVIAASTQPLANLSALRFYSQDRSRQLEYAKHYISKGLSAYEKLLEQTHGTFSFGGSLTIADLALMPQCYNALRFGVNLEAFPKIYAVYQGCLKLEHYQRSVPEKYE